MFNNIETTVASTRIRLARNLEGYPFPNRLRDGAQANEIIRAVQGAASRLRSFRLYRMDVLSEDVAQAICDDHLISTELAANRAYGAALIDEEGDGEDPHGKFSIMINEEDHLREQYILPGLNLPLAYQRLSAVDDALSKTLPFAFDRSLGYLTACPTNLGTGLRASVMLFLPGLTRMNKMDRLIREICAVQKNVVVVLHNGSPVTMPWIGDVSAVLESYLAGEAVGRAQIALLYGEANPCAKLAETFPLALSDTPCYRNFPGGTLTVEHREGIYVGYRYYDSCAKNVLFPFGHGLSYTTFEYTSARLNKRKLNGKTPLTVTVGVKNTGSRAGAEIVQVYVSKPESEVFRPEKELKGFAKVCLEPGEEKKVEITLQPRAFAYYNTEIHDWYCESGEYVLSVGASSRDIRKTLKITLENEQTAPVPYDRARMTSYYSAEISNVSDEQFSRLLGFPIPESEPLPGSRLTMENSFIDATSVPGRLVTGLVRLGANLAADDSMGDNDMIATSTLECPIHSAAAFSNGMLDDDGATQLLNILNGDHVLRSVGRLAVNVAGKAVKIAAAEAEKLYKNIKPKK